MNILLLESCLELTAIQNRCKNGKDTCDYQCVEKFKNDKFIEPKINVCKANCDVVWDAQNLKQLQALLNSGNLDPENVNYVNNRIETTRKKLMNSRHRLMKTKLTLRKVLYGRRASMSMRPVKNGPAFER